MRQLTVLLVLSLLSAGLIAGTAAPAAAQAPVFRIGDDEDLVRASIDVAQQTFASQEARRVVITRDDVFADSLAGTALAGTDGPILFVPGGERGVLPRETAAEIERLLGEPPSSCGRTAQVYLLGSEGAVGSGVEEDLEDLGYCTTRMAGPSRVETAVAIAREVVGDTRPDAVLLARADDWADAATGGAFAAAAEMPVLLTATSTLHPEVREFIDDVDPGEVFALGGTAALSEAVVREVDATRISGPSRAGTAGKIAEDLWPSVVEEVDSVVAINGYSELGWTFALMGAPFAAQRNSPMLYVQNRSVPPETESYLESEDVYEFTMVGPEDEIDAADALATLGRRGEVFVDDLWVDGTFDRYGTTLDINGTTYLQSTYEQFSRYDANEVRVAEYDLGRDFDLFSTTVGLSDYSPDTSAVVRFEVYDDQVLLEQVDVGFGESVALEVDVSGVLRLRVLAREVAGMDGDFYAGFGNPTVRPSGAPSVSANFTVDPVPPAAVATDAVWVDGTFDYYGDPFTIDGQTYLESTYEQFSRYDANEARSASYNLSRDYQRFSATIGQSDRSSDTGAVVRFEVFGDGALLQQADLAFGHAQTVDIGVAGVLRLELRVTEVAGHDLDFHAGFGDPSLAS